MPLLLNSKKISCFILSIFFFLMIADLCSAENFCATNRNEFHNALKKAALNQEDDIIRVVQDANLGNFKLIQEPGHGILIETVFNCENLIKIQKKNAIEIQSGVNQPPAAISTDDPHQSTTGPVPPPDMIDLPSEVDGNKFLAAGGTMKVLGVPGYAWRHGCGPTAVGMVLGYYDMIGFSDLFEGNAETQTEDVNQGIASQRDSMNPAHYEDYSLPMDDSTPDMLPDKSEDPVNDEHTNDCIADFMKTSWSSEYNRYGWSWSNYLSPAFINYIELKNPDYIPSSNGYYVKDNSLTWDILTEEIDNNRPMVFLVDTNSDGFTDHFVTIIGYSDSPTLQYACLDTWYPYDAIRWCDFAKIASGQPWGIWGGWTFGLADHTSPYDLDNDGDVDIVDVMTVAARWNTITGDPNYDDACDFDGDGDIDIIDVMKVAAQWGWTA